MRAVRTWHAGLTLVISGMESTSPKWESLINVGRKQSKDVYIRMYEAGRESYTTGLEKSLEFDICDSVSYVMSRLTPSSAPL